MTRSTLIALAALLTTASAGQAQRSASSTKLAGPAATAAVRPAFRAALAQASVRTAATAEILRQLKLNRPLAFTAGMWVTPIDMGRVYGAAGVRPALVAALGPNGPALLDGAMVDPGRIAVSFTAAELGSLVMGSIVKDIGGSLARDALRNNMTGVVGVDDVMIVMLVTGGTFLAGAAIRQWWDDSGGGGATDVPPRFNPADYDPNADPDGDGKPNYQDDDDDGDGVPDEEDAYPDDPSKSICDCSGRGGIFFTNTATDQVVSVLFGALDLAQAQARVATSLGAVAGSQAAVRVVIP
jgi:hypothetical protein